jgi:xanthine dehydrogenase accessory factor
VPQRLTLADALRHAREALAGGEAVVSVAVLSSSEDGPAAGERMSIWANRHEGTLGGSNLDEVALRIARTALAESDRPATHEVEGCTLYVEPHRAPPELVIVGAGHIARPLCRTGAMLGFRVTVLDDRPEFATRERFPEADEVRPARFDDPFRDVLHRPELPAYVGMIGSRRRTRAALEALAREGVSGDRLKTVHAPIGLHLGGETPEEIAVAIAAEIVMVRRGGTGQPLRDRERVAERWVRSGG